MKIFKLIFILIVFFKTETVLSENNLFNVNNIKIEKKDKISNSDLTNQAIKKGFTQLISRILLEEDSRNLLNLDFDSIKQLVSYYQISNTVDKKKEEDLVNFSITFDKKKIHNLFYKRGILYSDILDKELYVLPIFITNQEINVFNNNLFYDNWNEFFENDLIEFILPIENIEIIQKINNNKNSLIDLNIDNLFKEYPKKNLALILIEEDNTEYKKVYIKSKIQGKIISKSLNLNKKNIKKTDIFKEIIIDTKKELINLVKSRNLIDIRTPSFLNVKLDLNKENNIVEINTRIKKIDLIENVYVQQFNKDYMNLRIKYLGKLEKIINQLKKEGINLQMISEQWTIKKL
ncbi:MAG: hypothetical protein ISQ17_03410 [Pelagibacteraceae bacterium]|jgi:hypothetical protein|nr:hypothetical protein [Pelagibacteraceae bacterium]